MSKRIAYYALHYGADYLSYSVRSVRHAVDELHFLYTDRPSYGHSTTLSRPPGNSRQELFDLANSARGDKPIFWHDGAWGNEGEHRGAIRKIAQDVGASQVLVVDSDEVWHVGAAKEALDLARGIPAGEFGLPFIHLWRSFDWACVDPWLPIRIINVDYPTDMKHWFSWRDVHPIYHFGYAQSLALVDYKWHCHGHQAELRANWFEEKFKGWQPGMTDVHPTTFNIWNPATFLRGELEMALGDHPYYRLPQGELIR